MIKEFVSGKITQTKDFKQLNYIIIYDKYYIYDRKSTNKVLHRLVFDVLPKFLSSK